LWEKHISSSNLRFKIQFKVKFMDQRNRSISYVQIVKREDFEKLFDIFKEFWDTRSNNYHITPVEEIIYSFKFINDSDPLKNDKKVINRDSRCIEHKPFAFHGYNLPTTMDLYEWGDVIFNNNYSEATIYKKDSKGIYFVKLHNNYYESKFTVGDTTLFTFRDQIENVYDLTEFTRELNNHLYKLYNNEVIFKKIKRSVNFMKKSSKSITVSSKFLTMDFETRTINDVMSVICVSIYDGKNISSFYIDNYKNSEDLIKSSIKSILIRKYNNCKVYFHNFSNFDAVFLLRILSEISNDKLKPIIRDERVIDLKFNYGKNNIYKIYFRDSLLLLPCSLRELGKSFDVDVKKGLFPYKFINEINVPLNYIGKVPGINMFEGLSLKQYSNYSEDFNNDWNLKKELITYCETDVISLWKIIAKFQLRIFKYFTVDVLLYPTLSSLALGIYRSNFMDEKDRIPVILGNMYNDLKRSYTGGSVDVYKPSGENIYRYDVNSLYPYVMKNSPMPVGTPYYFEGNIFDVDKDAFGFFNVKVVSPKHIKHPILQVRLNTGDGVRTVCPIGSWSGMYFSEEIKNAEKYGYKFEVLNGYLFEKCYIFNGYVDFLYDIKRTSVQKSADYIISKLLLNSLYGRFGMSPEIENHIIIDSDCEDEYCDNDKYSVRDILEFNNGKELISYIKRSDYDIDYDKSVNISVAISSAITAYSRIHMSKFKNLDDIILFYSDTDSLDFSKPLNNKFIGEELGKLKLEHVFNKAVYLAPKVYGAITSEGKQHVIIKGLKFEGEENHIKYEQLVPLLNKDSKLKVKNEKWYKNWNDGNLTINEEVYTIMTTENKRKFVYASDNKIIDTTPIELCNGIIV